MLDGEPRQGAGWRRNNVGAAISLAIHAAAVTWMLSATAIPSRSDPTATPFEIELVRQPEPKPVTPPLPPSEPDAPTPIPAKPEAQPAAARPIRIKPPAAVMRTPVEPAEAAAVTPAATIAAEPAPAPVTASPAVSLSLDEELRAYGQLVWSQVTRRKPRTATYPGTTIIRFALSTAGSLLLTEVAESSGSPSLDRLALDAVNSAAPFPPPPAGAGETQLRFTIPFHFK